MDTKIATPPSVCGQPESSNAQAADGNVFLLQTGVSEVHGEHRTYISCTLQVGCECNFQSVQIRDTLAACRDPWLNGDMVNMDVVHLIHDMLVVH